MRLGYVWSKIFVKMHGKAIRGSKVDKSAFINSGSNVVNSSIGRYSYCGYDCWVIETDIGAFCSISNGVRIGGAGHPIDFVSTSPVFCKGNNVLQKNFSVHEFDPFKRTVIGNDVWIGEQCIIKAGVKIGDGAVIGTGSVVTKDVGDYEIWAGNPARLIRERFDKQTAEKLKKTEWWNYSDERLAKVAEQMNNVESFLNLGKEKKK